MKIKEQTRNLAADCSKYSFKVVDRTDEVSYIYSRVNLELYNITPKIFIEITLNSLINLFIFYFNLLYNPR